MRRSIIALVGLLGAALAVTACRPAPPTVVAGPPGGDLECAKGFAVLSDEIIRRPGIVAAEHERGSNAYRDDRTLQLFLITQPDHPAHPAIFVRSVAPTVEGTVVYSRACGYGDAAETDRMIEAYDAFDRLLNAEEICFLCGPDRLVSPTVGTRSSPPPPPSETDLR